jgi:hypothetical protein
VASVEFGKTLNDCPRGLPIIPVAAFAYNDWEHDGLKDFELRFGKIVTVEQYLSDGFEIDGSIKAPCFIIPNRAP